MQWVYDEFRVGFEYEIEWAVANVSQILMSVMKKTKFVDNDTDSN